jgi:hypothetical protein
LAFSELEKIQKKSGKMSEFLSITIKKLIFCGFIA